MSGCPSKAGKQAYDVYSRPINPDTRMPATPQVPVVGQKEPLSVKRVQSSIPKAGTESTWQFPSPQQFMASLTRKGKKGDTEEKDVEAVVAVHNNMNERTWGELMQWERKYHSSCNRVALSRFRGRPDELSPLARLRKWRGGGDPFDRHDWVIDRCGDEVRYVIDYYFDDDAEETKLKGDDLPAPVAHDDRLQAISFVVRPALDSPSAAWDRLREGFSCLSSWLFPSSASTPSTTEIPTPSNPLHPDKAAFPDARELFASERLSDDEFKFLTALDVPEVRRLGTEINTKCKTSKKRVADLTLKASEAEEGGGDDEDEDSKAVREGDLYAAQLKLDYCIGTVVCPKQADRFMHTLSSEDDPSEQYQALRGRIQRFFQMAVNVETAAAAAKAAEQAGEIKE